MVRAENAVCTDTMEDASAVSSLNLAENILIRAAGGALAVDRDVFSTAVTEMVEKHPNITVHREEVTALDESAPVLVASGPLTEGALAQAVAALTGDHRLSFYDAVAPIVTAESLDYDKVFAASRYGRGEADYLNCPFNKEEYEIIASGRRETTFFSKRGIPYYSVDITKEEDFDKLPMENIHAVMLLSAQIPSYMDTYCPIKYLDSIVIGGFNVLEYCRKCHVDRIIYTQTVFDISLYSHDTILKPDMKPNFSYTGDHAIYVISKNTALDLIEHYYQEYGLKKFIFRLPTIYSYSPYPYYFPNGVKTKRPIYQMIENAQKGLPIEIWGDPHYAKDMVHVNDFSQMLCKAVEVEQESGFYNVGTGMPITLEEQIRTIISVFSPKESPSEVIYRPDKVCGGGYIMNIENAKKELGYVPQYDCRKLFEDYKSEMEIKRFAELRLK